MRSSYWSSDVCSSDLLPGASVRILSGDAAGRQLFVTGVFGDTLLLDGFGADGNAKADGVRSGDQVEVDNDAYLAYCYWHRHHVINGEKGFDQVIVEDRKSTRLNSSH